MDWSTTIIGLLIMATPVVLFAAYRGLRDYRNARDDL